MRRGYITNTREAAPSRTTPRLPTACGVRAPPQTVFYPRVRARVRVRVRVRYLMHRCMGKYCGMICI